MSDNDQTALLILLFVFYLHMQILIWIHATVWRYDCCFIINNVAIVKLNSTFALLTLPYMTYILKFPGLEVSSYSMVRWPTLPEWLQYNVLKPHSEPTARKHLNYLCVYNYFSSLYHHISFVVHNSAMSHYYFNLLQWLFHTFFYVFLS